MLQNKKQLKAIVLIAFVFFTYVSCKKEKKETLEDMILRSGLKVKKMLSERFGTDLSAWNWEKIHKIHQNFGEFWWISQKFTKILVNSNGF